MRFEFKIFVIPISTGLILVQKGLIIEDVISEDILMEGMSLDRSY